MLNYSVGIVGALVLIYLAYFCYKKFREIAFRRLANKLSDRTFDAQRELNTLLEPTHLVEEKDIEDFKAKYQDLLDSIERLEEHKFFDEEVFDETGIAPFKEMLADIKTHTEKTNNVCNAIAELKVECAKMMEVYQSLVHPAHYFAFSELEDFFASYEKLQDKIRLVLPKYEKFVTDENIIRLPKIVKEIANHRREHNNQFVQTELENNKEYFDKVLGTYPLDPQQRDSIVKLEDNCLVIASAGSGKTSTIVGKAKYLVEKQFVDPSKILLLTYTKKAANELEERMKIPGLSSGTFHSIAYRIIAEATGMAPSICKADVPLNVFHSLIVNSPISYTLLTAISLITSL